MTAELTLTAAFFVAVLVSVVLAGYYYLRRSAEEEAETSSDRLARLSEDGTTLGSVQTAVARALHFMGESVPESKRDDVLRKRLLKAGYRWPSAATIFRGLRIASALIVAGMTGWVTLWFGSPSGSALLPAICGAGFGFLLPERALQWMVRARGKRIRSAVAPALDLLVLALEAGQSLDQALHDVARALVNSYPDLCEEFAFCRLEMRAGTSRHEALRRLSERSPDSELQKLTALLLDADRYGTSLGPALRTHGRYLRTRLRHSAQEQARKLTVKLTLPVFFLIFPSVLLVTLGPAVIQMRDALRFLLEGF